MTAADVVWTYSGVRPLYDDGASEAKAATRDYVLETRRAGGAPLLSIFGGKITTYRRLAEDALDRLAPLCPQRSAREAGPAGSPLPGGDFPVAGLAALTADLPHAIRSSRPARRPPCPRLWHAARRACSARAKRPISGVRSARA